MLLVPSRFSSGCYRLVKLAALVPSQASRGCLDSHMHCWLVARLASLTWPGKLGCRMWCVPKQHATILLPCACRELL